jgi:hypothetical protein
VQQTVTDNLAADYRAVYYEHVVASGDPSSWTFTISATANAAAAAVAYRGVGTPPVDASSNARFQGAVFTAPSLTTTHANDLLVAMFIQAQSMTLGWLAPTGMQVAVTAGDIGIFDAEQPVAGASGDKTAGFTIGGAIPGVGAVDFVALAPE